MKKIFLFLVCIGLAPIGFAQSVRLLYDHASPQTMYAAQMLTESLAERGYTLQDSPYDYEISLAVKAGELGSEAYAILPQGKKITVSGGDARGLIYGSLALAEDLRRFQAGEPIVARPQTAEGVDALARRAREYVETVIRGIQSV